MRRAARRFAGALERVEFRPATIPVYASIGAAPVEDPRHELACALEHPVLWVQTIRALADAGVSGFVEADPGHVLGDLAFEILSLPEPASASRPIAA